MNYTHLDCVHNVCTNHKQHDIMEFETAKINNLNIFLISVNNEKKNSHI